jgi:uncharacterized protein YbjT (DUF2867 family)
VPRPLILVTGATGTVGRSLILELKTRRAPLRVLTRDPAKARALLGDVDCAVGDLSRPGTVARALEGVEAAFLLSALDPELPSWEASFARAARKAGVKRLVKLSALGAAARSPSAIQRWHAEAEEEVKLAGSPFVVLRPSAFHQNLLGNAPSILRGTLSAPMGDARVATVDARDVAAAAAAALTSSAFDGRTLTLTGPEASTYADVAAILSRVLDRPIAYAALAPEDARRGMLAAGLPAWMTDALLGLAAELRGGLADSVTDGVREATGKDPVSVERFVRDHAAAFS